MNRQRNEEMWKAKKKNEYRERMKKQRNNLYVLERKKKETDIDWDRKCDKKTAR
jgi:hypothetical protein